MHPVALAKRSLTASCVLHLAALAGLAAWNASTDTIRPRFVGQSEVIETDGFVALAHEVIDRVTVEFDRDVL